MLTPFRLLMLTSIRILNAGLDGDNADQDGGAYDDDEEQEEEEEEEEEHDEHVVVNGARAGGGKGRRGQRSL